MCISPIMLPNGVEAACHECWQCREQRINDWVGRNIAESYTAVASHAVTLTYGRSRVGDVDHPRALILTYSDVQKFLKLLRRHGYPVRYFVTGEFGSLKGRAHWHIMLYWQDRVPGHIKLDQRFMFEEWPHGWAHFSKPTHRSIRYNCKYIQKDIGDMERQGKLGLSKKPPLGAEYFRRLAVKYVQQGLAPRDLTYSFPDVTRRKVVGGKLARETERVQFMLRDRSAELFLDHFLRTWELERPGQPVPQNDLVSAYAEGMGLNGWPAPGDERRNTPLPFPEGQRRKPRVYTAEYLDAVNRGWDDEMDRREVHVDPDGHVFTIDKDGRVNYGGEVA